MSIHPYNPDPTRDWFLQSYDEEIPLAFNVIYYVESPDDDALNAAMRQLAQEKKTLFSDTDIQPHPYRFQYLAQAELDEKALLERLSSKYDEEQVGENVRIFRSCLSEGKGGTLTARCLPEFSYDGYFTDNHTVCTFPGFSLTNPQEAATKAAWFAREVALLNFRRVSGNTYEEYQRAPRNSREALRGLSEGHLGFMIRKRTRQEITDEMRKHYEALSKWIDENIQNDDEMAITILDMALERRQQRGKLTEMLAMEVKDKYIYLYSPEKEKKEIKFRRGHIAKTLYIFFLIQIKRAEKDHNVPKYIAKVNLDKYHEDLLKIYQEVSDNSMAGRHNIESLWDKDSNDFGNALSSIRDAFDKIFDLESLNGKSYTIEIMDKDEMGWSLYGIGLDADDFKLGWPFNKFV